MESLYLLSQFLVLFGMALNVLAAIYLAIRIRKLLTVSDILGDNDAATIKEVICDLADLDDKSGQFNTTIKDSLLTVGNIISRYLIDIKNASADAYNRTINGFVFLALGLGCQVLGVSVQIFIHLQSK